MMQLADFMLPAKDVKNGLEMYVLSAEQFEHYWPEISKELDRVPHTWPDFTKDSLFTTILRGGIQVWAVGDTKIRMILFTCVTTWPTGDHLEIVWCGGNNILDEAVNLLDATLDKFAKVNGCSEITILGRDGWLRYLAPRGFKKKYISLSRPVVHEGMH